MKKGERYIGKVVRVDFPNRGLIEIIDKCDFDGNRLNLDSAQIKEDVSDYSVIVKNVVLDSTILFYIQKKRNGRAEGIYLSCLDYGAYTKEDKSQICPHFGSCGGCVYQNMDYKKQLEMKEGQIKKLLDEAVDKDSPYQFEGLIESPYEAYYRNKMEFTFGDSYKDGPLVLGLHKKNSMYDIVDIVGCKICHPDFSLIVDFVQEYMRSRNFSFYHKVRHEGFLRHLLVRRAVKTKEILICLVTTSAEEGLDYNDLAAKLKELKLEGQIAGFMHITNDSLADAVKNEKSELIFGRDFIKEEILGLEFKISAFSFFQTNSLGAERLYEKAREYASMDQTHCLFDLYSGTGTIGQMMASSVDQVIGVEIVEEAVAAANENAKLNGLDNCNFIASDVLLAIDNIGQKPDMIILDPPREGINPKALDKILNFNVDKMVYISCKASSLAFDLIAIQKAGYRVVKAAAVDMFPGTANVESVVLLSQQKADDYLEVEIDLDELDATSAETKATYEEIKKYVAEHNDGMKVSNLYIAQVKKKCGIELGQNFNLPKSENAKQPQCPKEKEDAIVEALKAFQMI